MPPDSPLPDHIAREVERWLRYAQDDLTSARTLSRSANAPPRHSAWHAQQAAEKALKAILIAEQRAFPYTHDLVVLYDLVPSSWAVLGVEADWSALSKLAVEVRYPDDLPT